MYCGCRPAQRMPSCGACDGMRRHVRPRVRVGWPRAHPHGPHHTAPQHKLGDVDGVDPHAEQRCGVAGHADMCACLRRRMLVNRAMRLCMYVCMCMCMCPHLHMRIGAHLKHNAEHRVAGLGARDGCGGGCLRARPPLPHLCPSVRHVARRPVHFRIAQRGCDAGKVVCNGVGARMPHHNAHAVAPHQPFGHVLDVTHTPCRRRR